MIFQQDNPANHIACVLQLIPPLCVKSQGDDRIFMVESKKCILHFQKLLDGKRILEDAIGPLYSQTEYHGPLYCKANNDINNIKHPTSILIQW